MDPAEFEHVAERFTAFHQRFSPFFGRPETRLRSKQYLQGLLVQDQERRSAENLAEAIDGATPRALQRLLTESPWPTAPLIRALQRYVGERLSEPDGVFVLDDTGFRQTGAPLGRGGPAVLGDAGQGRQLPDWRLPGLCLPSRPCLGRWPALPAASVDRGPAALPPGGGARRRRLSDQGGAWPGPARAGQGSRTPARAVGDRRRGLRGGAVLP